MKRACGRLAVAAAIAGLLAPLVAVGLLSLSRSTALDFYDNYQVELRWWAEAFRARGWSAALVTSAQVAMLSTMMAVGVALPAVAAARLSSRRRLDWLLLSTAAPLCLPGVVVAVGMNRLLSRIGWMDTLHGAATAHLPYTLAVVTLVLRAAAKRAPVEPFWSSRSLGARPSLAVLTWISTSLRGGIVAAAAIGFLTSVSEVTVSLFTTDLHVVGFSKWAVSGTARDMNPTGFAVLVLWFSSLSLAAALVLLSGRRDPAHG